MTQVSSVSGSSGVAAPSALGTAQLDKDAFLKLLVAQLQHQDPLQPIQDAEFMGQMAQFSTLEQITNMGVELGRLASGSQVAQAVDLLGRSVTYTRADGSTGQGIVGQVASREGHVVLTVNGVEVDPSSLLSIA